MTEAVDAQIAPDGFLPCGRKGDLALYLTHITMPGEQPDSALYIRNEHRKLDKLDPMTGQAVTGCPAYLLPLREFWKFRPEDRDRGSMHKIDDMVAALSQASVALYGLDVPQYRFRIHDAILEFADDVKNQRPPPGMTREEWLAGLALQGVTLKINGKAVN